MAKYKFSPGKQLKDSWPGLIEKAQEVATQKSTGRASEVGLVENVMGVPPTSQPRAAQFVPSASVAAASAAEHMQQAASLPKDTGERTV